MQISDLEHLLSSGMYNSAKFFEIASFFFHSEPYKNYTKKYIVCMYRYLIKHYFVFLPSESTVSENAGIESRTVVIHSLLDLIHSRLDLFHSQRDLIHSLLDLIHARLDIINMLDLIHKARSLPQYIIYSLKSALCFLAVLKSSGVPTATKATRGHKIYSDDINNISVVQCK
jgi:hypothetical protein